MAIYFVRARVIGRSGGRSAVAAAAYRSGLKITDEQTGIIHDYTKKQGVDHSEILSPIAATRANEWLADRSKLWNKVEEIEKRYDAQLSREMIIAIPRELDRADQIELVRQHVQSSYVDRGMIADLNLHHLDSDNPHAHVMLTMRELKIDERGSVSFGNKDRTWNHKKLIETQKKEWEILTNQYLERAEIETRIDCRSYQEQGIARISQVHVGAAAWRLEQQGIATVPGDHNRQVVAANQAIELAQAEIATAQVNIEIELRLEIERRAAEKAAKAARIQANRKMMEEGNPVNHLQKLRTVKPIDPPSRDTLIVSNAEKYYPTRLEIYTWVSNPDCPYQAEINMLGRRLKLEYMAQDFMRGRTDPGALPNDYQSRNVWISPADKAKFEQTKAEIQPNRINIPPTPTPTPAPTQKIGEQPTYHQEYQRVSAEIKRLIIEECEADPFTVSVPDFGESELKFIARFSKYITEKNGYTNPDQTEPLPVISDYQREYDRRTFEYVTKYPSEIMRREGLTDLHFNIEEAMKLAGYDRQKPTSENELSPANGHPITIDPDYQEEDEDDFLERLNNAVVHRYKSSQSTQRGQDDGMSM